MAGLLAWAADVVGGTAQPDDSSAGDRFPVVFTPEQQRYAADLDLKSSALRRSIQDLRLRIPPPDISQRLPHLHAHSLASNAALALQLHAHSATREQAQAREVNLVEENKEYEKAVAGFERRIREKRDEAVELQNRIREMDLLEHELKAELEKAQSAEELKPESLSTDHNGAVPFQLETQTVDSLQLQDLEEKKKELPIVEVMVQKLESEWSLVQQESLKQPSAAQREKILEKQLHSLIEQLTSKQGQAEGLMADIRDKEKELEKLSSLQRKLDSGNTDINTARNRYGRSFAGSGTPADYAFDSPQRTNTGGGKTGNQERLMFLRSAFVMYILALHLIVFIKLSF